VPLAPRQKQIFANVVRVAQQGEGQGLMNEPHPGASTLEGWTSNDVINTQEMDIEWNELGGHIINLTSKDYYCTRVGLRSYYPHL